VLAATSANLDAPLYVFRMHLPHPSMSIIDAACVTSATAGLSPPVSLSTLEMVFLDAGSFGYNNHTDMALFAVQEVWPGQTVDLTLSIGMGV